MSRFRMWVAVVWAAAHQVQTGYHISALNGIQSAILCRAPIDSAPWRMLPSWMLPYVGTLRSCVPMQSSRFGLIVALFTAGSLLGSLLSPQVTPLVGRVGTLRLSSFLCLLGSLFLAMSNSTSDMVFSRLLVGIGSGFSTVTVPLYLTELAPSLRNNLGILNQLAMVFGLIIAQSLALLFARGYAWRYILVIATALAATLLAVSVFVQEGGKGAELENSDEAHGNTSQGADERTELLGGRERRLRPSGDEEDSDVPEIEEDMSVRDVFRTKDKEVRRGFRVVIITQIAQQICGISPVIYFSTNILRKVFKANAAFLALSILLVKFPASLCTIPILPRTGSRKLLTLCKAFETISLFGLAIGLNADLPALSAVSIITFIFFFGLGTGPVTWVVLSEVMPPPARTAATSIGISLSSITSFIVSSVFLPLQEILMYENPNPDHGEGEEKEGGEGNVFFVFAAFCAISLLAVRHSFKRYERVVS